MAEMFEGRLVDWNKFTAKDAAKYTEEAQKYIQEKEYIDTVKKIAESATLGESNITLPKKLTDYTISRLKNNGFDVVTEKNLCYTTTTYGASIKNNYWTTTIRW